MDPSRDLGLADEDLADELCARDGRELRLLQPEGTPGVPVAPANGDWFGRDPDTVCGKKSPNRLGVGEQRKVGVAYLAGAVQLFTGRDEAEALSLSRALVAREHHYSLSTGRHLRAGGSLAGLPVVGIEFREHRST